MKLEQVIKTESEIKPYKIENDIITKIGVEIFGHFGDLPCLAIISSKRRPLIRGYNNIHNLGYLVRALVQFLEIDCENTEWLDRIFYACDYSSRGIPVRVIYDKENQIIGIGHITKDRFVLLKEFIQIDTM